MEKILLLSKDKSYLIFPEGRFSTKDGTIDFSKTKVKEGSKIKLGKKVFIVAKPNINDFLYKSAQRLPQVVSPKEASLIAAATGIGSNSIVVEAGTGSAFMTLFIANLVKRVYTYEKRKDFYINAAKNIKNSGLKNIVNKNKDITKGISEKNVDLVILDMQNPENAIKHAHKALRAGGFIAVFSMHVQEMAAAKKEIEKLSFTEPYVIENIQRSWKVESFDGKDLARPLSGCHSAFLTFARKI